MATINPYLNFMGQTEEDFKFYSAVFGGEFIGGLSRFKDAPDADKLPEDELHKVMHVALPIGKENTLMGTDALESMGHKVKEGNNISISVQADSKEEATDIFYKLAAGGEIIMPLEDAFWGAWFGMLTDKFGIQWMVNYNYNR